MCSWCYGFSPVIEAVATRLSVDVVMGGLRAGETRPLDAVFRTEIQKHWRHVHEASNQPFDFENGIPEGFIYNTEPACRAVVAIGHLEPARVLPMLDAVQVAFYAQARDVTNTATLAEIAETIEIDRDQFIDQFESETIRQLTESNFDRSREFGVTGFPTLLIQLPQEVKLVSVGYDSLASVEAKLLALGAFN